MKIIDRIIEQRRGHYCHALEVASLDHFEEVVSNIYSEFEHVNSVTDVEEFFESMQLYHIADDDFTDAQNEKLESELYDYDNRKKIYESLN